jgi:hypothetical protein
MLTMIIDGVNFVKWQNAGLQYLIRPSASVAMIPGHTSTACLLPTLGKLGLSCAAGATGAFELAQFPISTRRYDAGVGSGWWEKCSRFAGKALETYMTAGSARSGM